jgi:hypothetical protein
VARVEHADDLDGAISGVIAVTTFDDNVKIITDNPPIDVEGAIAAIPYDLGFPPPLGKLFFIIAGWPA